GNGQVDDRIHRVRFRPPAEANAGVDREDKCELIADGISRQDGRYVGWIGNVSWNFYAFRRRFG
ncbi:MAG TPA: hypothetical protein VK648_12520, partial [Gemmatimonadaceae bacterium]|nr:hypothetical protein [Gemmatimonadaceae bacterium]